MIIDQAAPDRRRAMQDLFTLRAYFQAFGFVPRTGWPSRFTTWVDARHRWADCATAGTSPEPSPMSVTA
jgi:hypothetical protein